MQGRGQTISGAATMAQNVFLSMLYLGTHADVDTDESNYLTEDASALLGTYGSASDPLSSHIVSVESDSANKWIDADHSGSGDVLTYDAGSGPVAVGMDSFITYNGTVTYGDGTTENIVIDIVQMANGDLFMPAYDTYTQFGAKPIESITLTSIDGDDWYGFEQAGYDSVQFICFVTGTRIATPQGEVPVEELKVGHLVSTMDCGPQPLLWIGRRRLRFPEAPDTQKPIEFKRGSLGEGLPCNNLVVSPQHRMFLPRNNRMKSLRSDGALAPAAALTSLRGVRRKTGCRQVEYHALLLAQHQIIFAERAPVESFYPGPAGLATLNPIERLSLIARVPQIHSGGASRYGPKVREVLSARETKATLVQPKSQDFREKATKRSAIARPYWAFSSPA